ncbi:ExbD/TolR family protein [Marivita geojedonensis]|uniref:Biopolymer transporter ExbD n=1 Tax=Marivita geojedonensis TaxID=1123756 RepID=A0A1X4NMZ5_9RHOB|nr:biopolymer transporter ExbD [Marivita geojedonensis]OSQ51916.1 biopolymer transporter ExbD [Marivita geojedonensis]PRY81351.1 biopolymer transport protein ExbD [Marivita geojedonensis]
MKLSRPVTRQPPETIVALIDVVFFLLVFFMLIGRMDATAPFDVAPPTAATGANMPAGGITISVSEGGNIAVDGVLVDRNALDDTVKPLIAQDANALVRINAHRETELRHVLPLVNRMEALGAQDVVLVVTPETSPPSQ